MTNTFSFNRNGRMAFTLLFSALGITTLFTACLKDNNVQPHVAALSVIHASPDAASFNFYLDDKKVNTNELSYLNSINYFQAFAGSRKAVVKLSTADSVLVNKAIDLTADKYYSLFVISQADSINYLLTDDDVSQPAAGKAKIRFIHLSADSNPLSLEVGQDTLFNDRAFKSYSTFKEVTPSTYTFTIKDHASGLVKATLGNVEITSGNIYTVWANGLSNTTVDNKKIGIKVNKAQ